LSFIINISIIIIFLGVYDRLKKFTFTQIKKIPKFKRQVEEETKKVSDLFENEVIENTKGEKYIVELPLQGIPRDELIKIVNRYLNLGKQYLFCIYPISYYLKYIYIFF